MCALAIVAGCLLPTAPALAQPALATQWQVSHAPAGYSLETRASALAADGSIAVLGVQRPLARGKDRSDDRAWIGHFGNDGQLKEQFAFAFRKEESAVGEVDAFALAEDGGYIVAGQSPNGESLAVHVSRVGAVSSLRALGRARVAFILSLGDGQWLLGGRNARDLFAVQLRRDGEVTWQRQLDRGFDELFLAGVPARGGALLLEHSGTREQFFMRDAVVGLTRVTPGDAAIRAPAFSVPGRAGAMAAGAKGLGLIVDTGTTVKQSLHFVSFDSELKAAAPPRPVLEVNFSLERARLAALADGDFLLLALDGGKLVGLRLSPDGLPGARFDSATGRVFLHPDVQARGEAAYMVASELKPRDDQRGARSMVYLARLSAIAR